MCSAFLLFENSKGIETMDTQKGTLYFFTGLAGAGKSTIGGLFYARLKENNPDAVLIDGHIEREKAVAVGAPRDYSNEARLAGAKTMFAHCKELTDQGRDVVCCSMSLFDVVRDWNRKNIENYREIYIKTDMNVLRQRRQNLYSGEQTQVVGLDLPWEEPRTPDVVIQNNGYESPEVLVKQIEKVVR